MQSLENRAQSSFNTVILALSFDTSFFSWTLNVGRLFFLRASVRNLVLSSSLSLRNVVSSLRKEAVAAERAAWKTRTPSLDGAGRAFSYKKFAVFLFVLSIMFPFLSLL